MRSLAFNGCGAGLTSAPWEANAPVRPAAVVTPAPRASMRSAASARVLAWSTCAVRNARSSSSWDSRHAECSSSWDSAASARALAWSTCAVRNARSCLSWDSRHAECSSSVLVDHAESSSSCLWCQAPARRSASCAAKSKPCSASGAFDPLAPGQLRVGDELLDQPLAVVGLHGRIGRERLQPAAAVGAVVEERERHDVDVEAAHAHLEQRLPIVVRRPALALPAANGAQRGGTEQRARVAEHVLEHRRHTRATGGRVTEREAPGRDVVLLDEREVVARGDCPATIVLHRQQERLDQLGHGDVVRVERQEVAPLRPLEAVIA